MSDRIQAPLDEGVGMELPLDRDPGHRDPQWYELDLDDLVDDPDSEPLDILPTARHRSVPEGLV